MNNKIKYILFILIGVCFILLIMFLGIKIYRTLSYGSNSYYTYYVDSEESLVKTKKNKKDKKNNNYETVIDHTIKFTNQNIKDDKFAIKLIKDTATKEEAKCKNNLNDVETDISELTGIYGVNLCEIELEDALQIYKVLKYVYDNYPFIKEYVTNITLVNDGGTSSYIAAFKPAFTFATSNSSNKFPFIIKIQVFLNSSYYLNDKYFNSVIKNATNTNHFPKDTNKESLIVHEFGHVLTYVLAINYYNSNNTLIVNTSDFKNYSSTLNKYVSNDFAALVVNKAYNNYIDSVSKVNEEDFRKNISGYANSVDSDGSIIYNETIAEAFHDYYLHGDNSKIESKYIINVINEYIKEVIK